MAELSSNTLEDEKKYNKLINNLLNINHSYDQAIFTRVNNVTSFDISNKFGANVAQKILEKHDLTLNLNETDLENLFKKVIKAQNGHDIIQAFDDSEELLSQNRRKLLETEKNISSVKAQIIDQLEYKIQKTRARWLTFRRRVYDANIQENIWQLNCATMFISLKTDTKTLYGPLLVKEAHFDVTAKNIKLSLNGAWKVNEKMVFLLNEEGISLKSDLNLETETAYTAIEKIAKLLKVNYKNINFSTRWKKLTKDKIENEKIKVHPGVVLGMFKPAGGHLRRTMLDIINQNEIEEILDPEVNKKNYQDNIDKFLVNDSDQLIKIQPSNFAQDRALISSLLNDTIIWGPPGTGKSQVIANLIANVLYHEKTAVVMSQKRAALDVLRKRLGLIAPFALFILNDNDLDKKNFYLPLQEFINLIEYKGVEIKKDSKKIISKAELNSLVTIQKTKINNSYDPAIQILKRLANHPNGIKYLYQLDNKNFYPTLKAKLDFKTYQKLYFEQNQVKKTEGLIFKRYPETEINAAQKSFQIINNNLGIDWNHLLSYTTKASEPEVLALKSALKEYAPKREFISDDKFLMHHLARKMLNKIENWRFYGSEKYRQYQSFANAVRAGRRLPLKFINDHKKIIKELFPIIITTPETSFIDWEKNAFDYAILDESSQMFIEIGLPVLYLAKTKILAGDNQQMQPTMWFKTRDELEQDDDLEDVPENAESILNYALDKGVYQVMLDQNYRSDAAALMSFSSKHFYNSNLEVIDRCYLTERPRTQPIEIINVKGKWEKSTNFEEVKQILDLVRKEKKNYKTILIIAFNLLQRDLLEQEIIEHYPDLYDLLEAGLLILRNIENVQGDEADLVVISVVYDKNTKISSTYVARPGGKNSLNVAISRAREKMIVVKSIMAVDIKVSPNEDVLVFKQWLDFLDMETPNQRAYSTKKLQPPIEDTTIEVKHKTIWSEEVLKTLKDKVGSINRFRIIPNYQVGSQKIDFAIVNDYGAFKLGLAIDNYHYEDDKKVNQYLKSLTQQKFLETKGYPIYRIKALNWEIEQHKVINEVNQILSN